ncbi:MAG: DUF4395 domain-containing protein [Thermomicrobiales bacterium]
MPIVTFNRAVLVGGILTGFLLRQPLFTTALFGILVLAVLFGSRGSLIFQVGRRLFAKRIATAEREDRRLMRFNNSIALVLLGLAQIAFVTGWNIVGWVLAAMVLIAASVALLGFCLGCSLYYRFKISRFRIMRWLNA